MEPRSQRFESHASTRLRGSRSAYQLGATAYPNSHPTYDNGNLDAPSTSSPSVSAPTTPAERNFRTDLSETSDSPEVESRDPSSGVQRSSSSSSRAGGVGEKAKRSRVTPEQLTHLERFFAADRNPPAARRKEIAEILGMNERQTQIWFQNRRAKAKLQDGKAKARSGLPSDGAPDSPPQLSPGFEVDLHELLHEEESISVIPCFDLSIGTWRRIATSAGKHDLVAYMCESRRHLTWFIRSGGYGFKMEIPFSTVLSTEFSNVEPGSGLIAFILSKPPLFFLEENRAAGQGGAPIRAWKKCADWTEGMQASKVMRHELVGAAAQLAQVLCHFPTYGAGTSAVQLANAPRYPPAIHEETGHPKQPLVKFVDQTPMESPSYHTHSLAPDILDQNIRRPSSGSFHVPHYSPTSYMQPSLHNEPHMSGLPMAKETTPSPFAVSPEYPPSTQFTSSYSQSLFSDLPAASTRQHVQEYHSHRPSSSGYESYHVPHSAPIIAPRPYTADGGMYPIPHDEKRMYSPPPQHISLHPVRRHSSAVSMEYHHTPSPPLLMDTSFHPRLPLRITPSGATQMMHEDKAIASGLPGALMYGNEDEPAQVAEGHNASPFMDVYPITSPEQGEAYLLE